MMDARAGNSTVARVGRRGVGFVTRRVFTAQTAPRTPRSEHRAGQTSSRAARSRSTRSGSTRNVSTFSRSKVTMPGAAPRGFRT